MCRQVRTSRIAPAGRRRAHGRQGLASGTASGAAVGGTVTDGSMVVAGATVDSVGTVAVAGGAVVARRRRSGAHGDDLGDAVVGPAGRQGDGGIGRGHHREPLLAEVAVADLGAGGLHDPVGGLQVVDLGGELRVGRVQHGQLAAPLGEVVALAEPRLQREHEQRSEQRGEHDDRADADEQPVRALDELLVARDRAGEVGEAGAVGHRPLDRARSPDRRSPVAVAHKWNILPARVRRNALPARTTLSGEAHARTNDAGRRSAAADLGRAAPRCAAAGCTWRRGRCGTARRS